MKAVIARKWGAPIKWHELPCVITMKGTINVCCENRLPILVNLTIYAKLVLIVVLIMGTEQGEPWILATF